MALYPDDLPWLSKPRALERRLARGRDDCGAASSASPATSTPRPERAGSHRAAQCGFDAVAERQSAAGVRRRSGWPRARPSSGWPSPGDRCRPDRSCSSAPTSSGRCAPRSGCGRSASAGISSPSSSRTRSGSRASHRSAGLVVPFADPAGRRVRKVRLSRREADGAARGERSAARAPARRVPQPRARRGPRRRRRPRGGTHAVHDLGGSADCEPAGGMAVRRRGDRRGGRRGRAGARPGARVVPRRLRARSRAAARRRPPRSRPRPSPSATRWPRAWKCSPMRSRSTSGRCACGRGSHRGESSPRPGSGTPAPGRCSSTTGRSSACRRRACPAGRSPSAGSSPALISYRSPTGRTVRRVVQWPTYRVVTRLTSPDIGDPTEHLAADTSLPPATYRIAPGTLQALLAALAALLVVAAGVLRLVRAAAAETGERSRTAGRSRERSNSSGRARRTATRHIGARRSAAWRAS